MTDLVRHRGPDDEGFVLFQDLSAEPMICGGQDTPTALFHSEDPYRPAKNIESLAGYRTCLSLGHRRLSILDVSPKGHQPMSSRDGSKWIVYNGEVYNHIELRAELESAGYEFVSRCDTEVILAAYQHWGKNCLSRFNGMFAFVIFDRDKQTIFAARDRFGIKPLYYFLTKTSVAFASEIKQFSVLPQWRPRMNDQRVYDFLNWGITDHTDETLFADVFQLRGGELLEIDLQRFVHDQAQFSVDRKLPSSTWYELTPQPFDGTMNDAAEQYRTGLYDSVRLRMRADVQLGSCLSGGLDSSSIVCIVNQLLREQDAQDVQKSFTACSEVARYDERKWADIVVESTGVDAQYTYPALSELFGELPKLTWHQDEPFGSTSLYAQWNVFRLAAENRVKVMLDGQGADEQLAGYHGFFGPRLVNLARSFRWSTMFKEASAMKKLHGYGYRKSMAYFANSTLAESIKDRLRPIYNLPSSHPEWLDIRKLNCSLENPFESIGAANTRTIQEFSIAQLTASNLQMLLHWEDRDSMGHSIEARVPFLDHRLVEFVVGLPDEFKLADGMTKLVLRESMDGILPERIRTRVDKVGFSTPEEIWLRKTAPELFHAKLHEAIDVSHGILRREEAEAMLNSIISGKTSFSFLPWRLISFGEWVKQFAVSH